MPRRSTVKRIGCVVLAAILAALPSSCGLNDEVDISEAALPEVTELAQISVAPAVEIPAETTAEAMPAGILPRTLQLSFLGDCMLSTLNGANDEGTLNWYAQNYPESYFFAGALPYTATDDITIANCETVLSDADHGKIAKEGERVFWFRGHAKNAEIFRQGSVEAVSLDNNHTGDYGDDGYADTVAAIENAGIMWGGAEKTLYLEKNGVKVAIICHKMFRKDYEYIIMQRLEEAKAVTDVQIIFFHGGTEYSHTVDEWMPQSCHNLIDNGADLIVGCHTHCLRPVEEYKGVNIAYSIGNFCYGGNRMPENRTVIYQQTFTFDDDNNIVSSQDNIVPFYVYTGASSNWQPAPIYNEDEKQRVLDFMYGKIDSPL